MNSENFKGPVELTLRLAIFLREFESVKIDKHDEAARILALHRNNPALVADTVLYRFRRKYALTLDQVQRSLAPIHQGILGVLARLQERAQGVST